MLIKNINLINCKSIIGGKSYSFDEKGIAEIEDKLAQELLKLKGYTNVNLNTKKLAEGQIEPIIEEKEEPKVNIDGKEEKENINYKSLSKNELKELAIAKDIDVPSNATKAELIDILSK